MRHEPQDRHVSPSIARVPVVAPNRIRCNVESFHGKAAMMIVDPIYCGYRIEVSAIYVNGAWDAEARIQRLFSHEQPHLVTVTCQKLTAQVAEECGVVYARRCVDRHGRR